jgi:predicted nucleotide-binding protein (sugar kinase/HSP70/actin superfamily)
MKNANLFIGLGIGLLVGAAVGAYFATSDEKKQEYMEELNARVIKAKEKVGKAVSDGLEQLEKVGDKINKAAQDVFSKAKEQQA